MSRFNNVNAVFAPRKKEPEAPRAAAPVIQPAAPAPPARTKTKTAANLILPPNAADVTMGQKIGFVALSVYLLAGYANEFAIRALGTKAYVSTALVLALPVVLLVSGNTLRGLRDVAGRLWLGFIIWLCLAAPFSVWRGGTAATLRDYTLRCWLMFFLIVAFTVTFKHCRWLMGVLIAGNVLLLIDCAVAAHISIGRLDIPGSLFFANANDLCLQLVLAMTQFFYLLFQPSTWKKVVAVAGIMMSLVYALQTGSRGGAIGIVALVLVVLLVASQRVLIGGLVAAGGLAALLLVPSAAFHRISLLSDDQPADSSDAAAAGSRMQRLVLLRQSVELTLTHPLFGVGPGQFMVAVDGEAQKTGQRSLWLGTHNSYTEVSSECGIPALIMYTGILLISMWTNLRIYRRSLRFRELRDLRALAFCGFCGCVVFAVATFFSHIAYTGYLPMLSGMTVALRLTTSESLWGARQFPTLGPSLAPPLTRGAA